MRRPTPDDSPYRILPVNLTAICHKCKENDIESILVDYPNDPSNFYQCKNCSLVIKRSKSMHRALEGPLGSVLGIGRPKFEVASFSKRHRVRVGPASEATEPEIPKFSNGFVDRDLEAMCKDRPTIILSIQDSVEGENNYD